MFSKIISFLNGLVKKQEYQEENVLHKIQDIVNLLQTKNLSLKRPQIDMITFLFQSNSKFKAIEAPTGSGKTWAYIVYALSKFSDKVIIISTFSKALQNQILKELENIFNVKPFVLMGKSNYVCYDKLSLLPEHERKTILQLRPKNPQKNIFVSSYYCRKDYRINCEFYQNNKCEYFSIINSILNHEHKIIVINHHLINFVISLLTTNYLLVVDEAHFLPKENYVHIKKEDFTEPAFPELTNEANLKEYNLKLEMYYIKKQKYEIIKKYNISQSGKYPVRFELNINNDYLSECIFVSATLPPSLPVLDVDIFKIKDERQWENIKIIIEDVNYKSPKYIATLKKTIDQLQQKYKRIIILATSLNQLDTIKNMFPHAITTKDVKPFTIVEKLRNFEINLAAGTDIFWTGIDVPGEKAIIMTKLPFPAPDDKDENTYITGVQEMFTKFKQGVGRMLRSPKCKGEIIILDNRIIKYPEVINFLEELKQKGASIIYKGEIKQKEENTLKKPTLFIVK